MNQNIELSELAKRESERVEWKENVANIENIVKTIVAFANDYSNLGGGYVVCGAKEGKDDHGFQKLIYEGLTASRMHEITQKVLADCRNKVNPEIVPCVEEIIISGNKSKRILIFIIPATNNAHSYRTSRKDSSTYYIRSGSNTIEARNGLLRELLIRKKQLEPWDRRINPKSKIENIDLIIFREYLQEMGLWSHNKSLEDYISDREKLSDFTPPLAGKIGLETILRLKNFSILMFGKKPLDFFEGAYVIFSKYKGDDRSEPTGERQLITGTIIQQARKLIELLNSVSYTAFDKTTETPNQIKYPSIALKEAVINALVHRDYESDQPIRVTVFEDRIEFYSPGGVPIQVDKKKFKIGKATAYWRNQALNYLFNKMQLAQAEGQGIPTIFKAMREEGCPEPVFEIDTESVTCILPAHPRHQTLRVIYDVENTIVLGNYTAAYNKLEEILKKDAYNFRALELFCKVNSLLKTPHNVLKFIKENNIDFKKINSGTVTVIAETLASISEKKE
ncbi:transcriptional regulator [Candidatus Magnetomorum sp. HK-1]|nr:transcriptional regulator [Candidatus Magnetomorum sp. HK-1]